MIVPQKLAQNLKPANLVRDYLLSIILLCPLIFSNDTIRVRLFKSTYFLSSILVLAALWPLFGRRVIVYRWLYALFCYLGVSLVSALVSPYYPISFEDVLNSVGFSILLLVLIALVEDTGKFMFDLSLVLAAVLVIAGLEYLNLNPLGLPSFDPGRISGPLINPNFFADFLSVMIPLFFFYGLFQSDRRKLGYYTGIAVLALLAMVLSRSRTGVLAAGISLTLFFIAGLILSLFRVETFSKKRFVAGVLIVTVTLVALVGFGAAAGLVARFKVALTFDEAEPLMQRVSVWESAVNISRDYRWLGSGPGTFKYMYPMYKLPLMWKIESALFAEKAHQQYLEFISERGLLGLLSFILLTIMMTLTAARIFIRDRQNRPLIFSATAAVTAVAVASLASSFGQIEPNRMMFIIVLALPFMRPAPATAKRPVVPGANLMLIAVLSVAAVLGIFSVSRCFLADVYGYRASQQRVINRQANQNKLTIAWLERARDFNPYKPNFPNLLDEVHGYDGDQKAQIDNFAEASRYFYTYPLHLLNEANGRLSQNQFDRAERLYLKAIRINVFYANPFFMIGSACLRQKEYDRALRPARHYLRLGGDNDRAYKMIADIYLLNQDHRGFLRWTDYSRAMGKWFDDYAFNRVYVYYKLGQKRDALRTSEEELKFYPENSQVKEIYQGLQREINFP